MESSYTNIYAGSLEEYIDSVKHVDQIARQISGGKYIVNCEIFYLPNLHIMKTFMSCKTLYEGKCEEDFLYFVIPSSDQVLKVNGNEIGQTELYLLTPEEEVKAIFPSDFSGYYICINKDEVAKLIGEDSLAKLLKQPEKLRSGNLILPNLGGFKKSISEYIQFTFKNHTWLSLTSIHDLQENIFMSLVNLFEETNLSEVIEFAFDKRLAVVKRSLEYINSSNKLNIGITNLAEQSCCSIRTLEYSFKKIYGLSPKQYLIIRRMHMIKKELETNINNNIANILPYFGVVNAGRFSQDYFQLFGEYPKESIRKLRKKY